MTNVRKVLLEKIFKKEIYAKLRYIDIEKNLDYNALITGWAIAKGEKPSDALDFSTYIRYNTDMR